MNLCDLSTIKYIEKTFGFRNVKSLGQNFLLDNSVIQAMVSGAGVTENDLVLEIGPGIGTLTQGIATLAAKVLAYEIDKNLLPVLKFTLGEFNNVEIVNEDILKADLDNKLKEELAKGDYPSGKVKVMGNLPYYITTPIITGLIESNLPISDITIMMQREVAERIISPPGSRNYGALSVDVQFYAEVEEIVEVPKESFFPAPKVDSTVLKLTMRPEPAVSVKDRAMFFKVVKAGFGQRRKTLRNSLAGGGFDKDIIKICLDRAGIDGERRAETLSLDDFARLADAFTETKL